MTTELHYSDEHAALTEKMTGQISDIGERIDRLQRDNRAMIRLLSQAALFVAMQPENAFRRKWLEEVERLTHV